MWTDHRKNSCLWAPKIDTVPGTWVSCSQRSLSASPNLASPTQLASVNGGTEHCLRELWFGAGIKASGAPRCKCVVWLISLSPSSGPFGSFCTQFFKGPHWNQQRSNERGQTFLCTCVPLYPTHHSLWLPCILPDLHLPENLYKGIGKTVKLQIMISYGIKPFS